MSTQIFTGIYTYWDSVVSWFLLFHLQNSCGTRSSFNSSIFFLSPHKSKLTCPHPHPSEHFVKLFSNLWGSHSKVLKDYYYLSQKYMHFQSNHERAMPQFPEITSNIRNFTLLEKCFWRIYLKLLDNTIKWLRNFDRASC